MVAAGIVIATVAAFVLSAVYYGAMPAASATEHSTAAADGRRSVLVELVRNLAVAGLVAGLLGAADWSGSR